MLCSPDTTFARGSEGKLEPSWCSGTLSSTRPCLNSCSHSGRSRNGSLRTPSLSSFYLGFRFLLVHATSFLELHHSHTLSLPVDAGCCVTVTASCDEDVRHVGEDELEELVDRQGTTNGTYFAVLHSVRLPFLMSCGF